MCDLADYCILNIQANEIRKTKYIENCARLNVICFISIHSSTYALRLTKNIP